jgi:hypothetical protein
MDDTAPTDAPRKTRSGAVPTVSQRPKKPRGKNANAGTNDHGDSATSPATAAAVTTTAAANAVRSAQAATTPSKATKGKGAAVKPGKKGQGGPRCAAFHFILLSSY